MDLRQRFLVKGEPVLNEWQARSNTPSPLPCMRFACSAACVLQMHLGIWPARVPVVLCGSGRPRKHISDLRLHAKLTASVGRRRATCSRVL